MIDVCSAYINRTHKKKSNITATNYFTTFLQNVDMTNLFIDFHLSPPINIIFSFTNNHSPYQPFVK